MKINEIKINNYGKLAQKEINLENKINIIYGKNESGKSTLLNFISSSFYGISKNKRGKEISDFDKYIPWIGEEFSGKLEYELDDGRKFEIYRDFRKKNPKIFNENKEDISKQFNIDKNKGNEFFYEQTKVDEELFLSTILVNQQEIKLGKQEQNILIQKLANLVGTGDDNVSYKRAIERINRRQLDEIGTQRSREKPINIIEKEIEELEKEKQELDKYEEFKYKIEENKNNLNQEIEKLENENNYLKEIKLINENQKIEKEKIKIKENIKNKNSEKINLLKNKLEEIENNNKDILELNNKKIKNNFQENNSEKNKLNKKIIILFFILLIINIIQFIFIKNNLFKYLFIATIPIYLIICLIIKNKLNKKIKIKENKIINEKKEKINSEINNLKNEINLLEKNNNELKNEINNLENNFNLKINLEKEKIKNKYSNKIEKNKINNLENTNYEIQNIENKINNKKLELHTLELDIKNIEPRLENIANIQEKLVNNKEKMLTLKNLEKSMNLAKEVLAESYERMKSTLTPKFTENLSENISKITDGKYSNIQFHDEKGLIVELENGNYVSAMQLSVGTIEQLYLSLRLSMVEELSEEKMPIILDEVFAYYDSQRLKNILEFINDKFKNHQIIIFTCTNREKDILNELNIDFNAINL